MAHRMGLAAAAAVGEMAGHVGVGVLIMGLTFILFTADGVKLF